MELLIEENFKGLVFNLIGCLQGAVFGLLDFIPNQHGTENVGSLR